MLYFQGVLYFEYKIINKDKGKTCFPSIDNKLLKINLDNYFILCCV